MSNPNPAPPNPNPPPNDPFVPRPLDPNAAGAPSPPQPFVPHPLNPWPDPTPPPQSPAPATNDALNAGMKVIVDDGLYQTIGTVVGQSPVNQKRPLVQLAQLHHGTGIFAEKLLLRADGKKGPLEVGMRVWFKNQYAMSGVIAKMNFDGTKNHIVHYARIAHSQKKIPRSCLHRIDKDPCYQEDGNGGGGGGGGSKKTTHRRPRRKK